MVVFGWCTYFLTDGSAKLSQAPPAGPASTEELPQTLVRIPTEHAPTLQAQAEAAEAAANDASSIPLE